MSNDSESEKSKYEKIFGHYSWGHTWGMIGVIVSITTFLLSLDHTPAIKQPPAENPSQYKKPYHINPLSSQTNKYNKHSKQLVAIQKKNKDIKQKEDKTINSHDRGNAIYDKDKITSLNEGIITGRTVYPMTPINGGITAGEAVHQNQDEEVNPNFSTTPNASRF
jgi:hypothetical protein